MKIKSQKGTSQRVSEVFGGPLGDPLGRGFSFRRLLALLPRIVLPVNLSPNPGVIRADIPAKTFGQALETLEKPSIWVWLPYSLRGP